MDDEQNRQYFMMMKEAVRLSQLWFRRSKNTEEYWTVTIQQSQNYIETCERYGKGKFATELITSIIDEIRRTQENERC